MKLAFKAKSLILLLIFMLLVTMSLKFNALVLAPPTNCIIVNQKLLENYQFRLNMFPLRAVIEQLGYDVQ